MGKSKKAPDYATTTVDTGLYGTSTTTKQGTTFTPTNFQSNLVNTVENNIPNMFNNYYNSSYNNNDFQKYLGTRENAQTNAFNNTIYNQLEERGLMKDKALAGSLNAWQNTLENQRANALSDWQTEQANSLNTLMGLYEVPYNIISGQASASQGLSNAITQYNVGKYNAEKAKSGNLFNLLSEIGASAGSFGNLSKNTSGSKSSNL